MATNVFFNNYSSSGEQNLLEDLIIESIKIFGQDSWYIVRTNGSVDEIFNEDDLPEYNAAHELEMYIKNVEGFEGQGDIFSRFGLEIRDQMTFSIAKRRFEEDVSTQNADVSRPREGDLIFFPLNNKIFKIMFVEHEEVFYQLGKIYLYDVKCELYEYSNETFNTGIPAIDNLYSGIVSTTAAAIANVETVDTGADNISIETEADDLIDFSEGNPFTESGRW